MYFVELHHRVFCVLQADVSSDKPGPFDFIREGLGRLMGWGMPQTTRLLPIYTLVLPTAVMGVSQYIIIQVARATMLSTFRQREQEMRVRKSIGLLQQINFTQLSCSAFMNMVIKTDLRTLKSVIYCNFFSCNKQNIHMDNFWCSYNPQLK